MKVKKKSSSVPSGNRKKIFYTFLILTVIAVFSYCNYSLYIKKTYTDMKVSFKSVKEIEYGTGNFDPMKLVNDISEGATVNYKQNIDTSKVGTQEIVFEVSKNNVVKTYNIKVEVKDSNAPSISLKNKEITINKSDNFDLVSNIESVKDVVDGDIPYVENSNTKPGYTISTDFDNTKAGKYTVNIKAIDSNNNTSENSYVINVVDKKVQNNFELVNQTYSNEPASVDTTSVISAAYSLLGSKYTYGGNNPSTGFDCSGFVQYIYSAVGKSIGRSSSAQLNNGFAVERSNIQPGDIVIWSTQSNNAPTHASIYVGDGSIIHAINSSKGVQKTNMNSWENGGGGHIVSIRRV